MRPRRSTRRLPRLPPPLRAVAAILVVLAAEGAFSPGAAASPTAQAVSGWSLVENNTAVNATAPDIAVGRGGATTAVWLQWETATSAGNSSVWSADFDEVAGWSAPQRVDQGVAYAAVNPRIVADGAGAFTAVWSATSATGADLWASRRTAGSNWSAPVRVGPGSSPALAADGGGNVTMVWRYFSGATQDIWSARFAPGAGWSAPALVEFNDSGNADAPAIAASTGGTAFAVWSQFIGGVSVVWASRYVPGAGWSNATLLPVNTTTSSSTPQIAADGLGDAHAVWLQSDGTRNNVWTARNAAGAGWGAAALLETLDASQAASPQVAFSPGGSGVALWTYRNGTQTSALACNYTLASGWSAPQYIEFDDAGPVILVTLKAAADGGAFAAWLQSNGTVSSVWAARFRLQAGWGAPLLAEDLSQPNPSQLRLAVGGEGRAAAVWVHPTGLRADVLAFIDDAGPVLALFEPADGLRVSYPTVRVRGVTDPNATLFAAGLRIAVAPDGAFDFNVALLPGTNRLVVVAVDEGGVASNLTRTVTFADPAPGLAAALNVTNTLLNASFAQLAALTARIGAAETQLSALGRENAARLAETTLLAENLSRLDAELDAVAAELAASASDLSVASTALTNLSTRADAAEVEADALEAQLAVAESSIASANANLTAARQRLDAHASALADLEDALGRTSASANETRTDLAILGAVREEDRDALDQTASEVASLSAALGWAAFGLVLVGALAAGSLLTALRRRRPSEGASRGDRAPHEKGPPRPPPH